MKSKTLIKFLVSASFSLVKLESEAETVSNLIYVQIKIEYSSYSLTKISKCKAAIKDYQVRSTYQIILKHYSKRSTDYNSNHQWKQSFFHKLNSSFCIKFDKEIKELEKGFYEGKASYFSLFYYYTF